MPSDLKIIFAVLTVFIVVLFGFLSVFLIPQMWKDAPDILGRTRAYIVVGLLVMLTLGVLALGVLCIRSFFA